MALHATLMALHYPSIKSFFTNGSNYFDRFTVYSQSLEEILCPLFSLPYKKEVLKGSLKNK